MPLPHCWETFGSEFETKRQETNYTSFLWAWHGSERGMTLCQVSAPQGSVHLFPRHTGACSYTQASNTTTQFTGNKSHLTTDINILVKCNVVQAKHKIFA